LAKAIEPTVESLASSRNMLVLATLEPSGGEQIIGFLGSTAVRALLTTIFLLSMYMALSHPGHGMPEVIAVVALAVLVGVPLLTGYAQWWEIMAILIGMVLLAVEIFVLPGFGVAGISGIILIALGLTMTWVGNEPPSIPGILPKLPGTWSALQTGFLVIVGGMACSLVLWFWLQKYLPSLPYLNKLILSGPSGAIDSTVVTGSTDTATWPLVGAIGKAVTDLRPGGSASFFDASLADARMTDVVSDSGFVRAGTEVVVREVTGNRVVVRVNA
jgi:membrane-bound serine protease (ClpP class)